MGSPSPEQAKAGIRQRLRQLLRELSPESQREGSGQICARLLVQEEWRKAGVVLLFWPIGGEPDVRPLVEKGLQQGKIILLPRLDAVAGVYHAARIQDPAKDLREGAFGIGEPRADCPEFPLNRLDFAFVPGLGFTLDGGRLGRGRGFYDRLLAAVPGFKCGVAYDCQVVRELPLETFDVRLDCILTPTRWQLTAGRARS